MPRGLHVRKTTLRFAKGKPVERRGRKATGLTKRKLPRQRGCPDELAPDPRERRSSRNRAIRQTVRCASPSRCSSGVECEMLQKIENEESIDLLRETSAELQPA